MQKSYQANAPNTADNGQQSNDRKEQRRHNSTYPKGGVSCSKDSFVVNGSLVFQTKFCGKSPALRVDANRWCKFKTKKMKIILLIGFSLLTTFSFSQPN